MSPVVPRSYLFTLLLPVLGGCGLYISAEEHRARIDRDLDGSPVTEDCDDRDPQAQQVQTWFEDADADGVGGDRSVESCNRPPGHVLTTGDCNDADPDHQVLSTWYPDEDDDGFGTDAGVEACGPPPGHVARSGDCNDQDPAIHPDAVEICNLIDDNCDGTIDEDAEPTTWFVDADGDGFGSDDSAVLTCDIPDQGVLVGGDCDDENDQVHPDADEVCNGIDDDCDTLVDDDDPGATDVQAYYIDRDQDGWGDGNTPVVLACDRPEGHVDAPGDCDDHNAARHPDHDEICDGIDNDCDNLVDDDDPDALGETWYADTDGDGFGDPNAPIVACIQPPNTQVDATDCDDTDPDVHPARPAEITLDDLGACSDGQDDDCDTLVDGDDPDCADTDGDGIADVLDAIYPLDCHGTGRLECLCARADLVMPPEYAVHDAYRVHRSQLCLIGCVPTPTDRVYAADRDELDALDDGAWCWDLTQEEPATYWMRWASVRSASNPDQDAALNQCSSWEQMDLSTACGALGDPYCAVTTGALGGEPHVASCDSGSTWALRVPWDGSSL